MSVVGWVHMAVALSYAVTAALVLWRGKRALDSWALVGALVVTALWGGLTAASEAAFAAWAGPLAVATETFRSWCWIFVLVVMARRFTGDMPRSWYALCVVGAGLALAGIAVGAIEAIQISVGLRYLLDLGLAVVGLVAVENVIRNLSQSQLWALKYLLAALVTMFALDVLVQSVVFLFREDAAVFTTARAVVVAALIPLLLVSAVRSPKVGANLHASRGVVFYSATLVGSGVYLIVTALVGSYVRSIGGEAATSLSIVVVVLSVLGLALALLSQSFRSRIRLFIAENFFSYRFDYRVEWSRLIATVSSDGEALDLRARVIKAVCEPMDSRAGSLWLRGEAGELLFAAAWHMRTEVSVIPAGDPLAAALDTGTGILNLEDATTLPPALQEGPGSMLAAAVPNLWLVVPLVHRDRVIGVVAAMEARVRRDLTEEDYQLLHLIGRQIASYLAEEQAYRALMDARQLEDFNKRFAFVIHDIKNLTGQLSLLVRNVERHGDNPAFRADLTETLRNSVDKMRGLLEQLNASRSQDRAPERPGAAATVDVLDLARRFVARRPKGDRDVVLDSVLQEMRVPLASAEKLTNVLEHLVQNAVEATTPGGIVRVALQERGSQGMIEVTDTGPGMDAAFIREELFRPFRSTKKAGFGIGAYQARETVKELGGTLEVESVVGQGTTMRILLPRAQAAAPVSA